MRSRTPVTLILVLLSGALAGELVLSGILRLWPAVDAALAVNIMYIAVKLGGDLMCRITRRSVDEWGSPLNYLTEIINHWLTYSVLLAFLQVYFAGLAARGTLGWRIGISSFIADVVYIGLRRKKEIELANAHVLGRRAKVKYGLD